MPTGYTATLADGPQDFRTFAMRCARAFGALVHMRDSGLDAPIPDVIQPSAYNAEQAHEARTKLAAIEAMTEEQATRAAQADHERALSWWRRDRNQQRARAERYTAMLAQVEAWKPPTPDHEGLKQFMADQLRDSLRWDCGHEEPEPVCASGEAWKAAEIERLRADIAYHVEAQAKEEARAAERTRWISTLRGSLPGEASP